MKIQVKNINTYDRAKSETYIVMYKNRNYSRLFSLLPLHLMCRLIEVQFIKF